MKLTILFNGYCIQRFHIFYRYFCLQGVLMTGSSGTAKTSTALLFFDNSMEQDNMRLKKICFSSATSPAMFQVKE